MDATPIDLAPGGATSLTLGDAFEASGAWSGGGITAARWAALHDAATVVAALAGVPAEEPSARVRAFPAAIAQSAGWRRDLAEQGVEDMRAMMEPGLAALLSVHGGGGNAAAPAAALWEEFRRSRDALLSLVPPTVR